MTFLLANWRYVLLIGILAAGNVLFWNLWQTKSEELVIFKAEVAILGRQAEDRAKEVESHQLKVLEDVSNAWNRQLPAIREDAVDAYKRRYPNIGLRLPNAGSGKVPRVTIDTESSDGAGKEPVVACTDQFISDSAEDSLKIDLWQEWARQNKLPVR